MSGVVFEENQRILEESRMDVRLVESVDIVQVSAFRAVLGSVRVQVCANRSGVCVVCRVRVRGVQRKLERRRCWRRRSLRKCWDWARV